MWACLRKLPSRGFPLLFSVGSLCANSFQCTPPTDQMRGVREPIHCEMTVTLEKTARSSDFNLAHANSTVLFDPESTEECVGHLNSLRRI